MKARSETLTALSSSSGLPVRVIALMLAMLILLPSAVVSAQSANPNQGALVQLDGDKIHVVWKLHIEYDDTRMADEMDNLLMTYQVNQRLDKQLETQLQNRIEEAVGKKIGTDYDVKCENLVLKVNAELGLWTDINLEFDLNGVVRLTKTEREFNMAWKSMKVEGSIILEERNQNTVVKTYKFNPGRSLALDWKPFSRDLESWEITQKDGYTECYYRQKTAFPVAFESNAYNVEILFKLPGEPTIKGNQVVYNRDYIPYSSPFSAFLAMMPQLVLAGVAVTGIGGTAYVYRRRKSKGIEKKLFKRALARKEFQDFEEALELWSSQSENPRLERIYGWRDGSPVINIPKMRFKDATKDYFLDEYLLGGE